jgi:MOSC domain-containing protein YiiM
MLVFAMLVLDTLTRGVNMSGRLEQIWVKRAHRGVMDPVDAAALVAGKGIEGSANFGAYRQVTIVALERWLEMLAELGADVDPAARRAELLVSGIELQDSRGRLLEIGSCVLRIGGETRPCERMDEAYRGLGEVMKSHWRGGAWAEVLRGGPIRVADRVDWQTDLFSRATG